MLVAIGIDWEGRRRIPIRQAQGLWLGVEMAGRESATSWREFLLGLKARRLRGVRMAVSDDHAGLKRAIAAVLPEAAWQRCRVHFPFGHELRAEWLRNALDHLPRKVNDDCLTELRWLYDLRNASEAQLHLRAWLEKWAAKYPRLCTWVEESIEETWTFYRPFDSAQGTRSPREHHKHFKSTNLLERLNQELKRRTHLPQPGELPAAHPRAGLRTLRQAQGRGAAGRMARRPRLSRHATAPRSAQALAPTGRLNVPPEPRQILQPTKLKITRSCLPSTHSFC